MFLLFLSSLYFWTWPCFKSLAYSFLLSPPRRCHFSREKRQTNLSVLWKADNLILIHARLCPLESSITSEPYLLILRGGLNRAERRQGVDLGDSYMAVCNWTKEYAWDYFYYFEKLWLKTCSGAIELVICDAYPQVTWLSSVLRRIQRERENVCAFLAAFLLSASKRWKASCCKRCFWLFFLGFFPFSSYLGERCS